MPDDLLLRLRNFQEDYFPHHQQRFQDLVAQGQHPKTLFIGCSDSRLVPYLLTGAAPGELFLVRNVGAFVRPTTSPTACTAPWPPSSSRCSTSRCRASWSEATAIAGRSGRPMKA